MVLAAGELPSLGLIARGARRRRARRRRRQHHQLLDRARPRPGDAAHAHRPLPHGEISPDAARSSSASCSKSLAFVLLWAHGEPALGRARGERHALLRLRVHDLAEAAEPAEHRDRRRRRRGAGARRLGRGHRRARRARVGAVRDRVLLDAAALLGAVAQVPRRLRGGRHPDAAGGEGHRRRASARSSCTRSWWSRRRSCSPLVTDDVGRVYVVAAVVLGAAVHRAGGPRWRATPRPSARSSSSRSRTSYLALAVRRRCRRRPRPLPSDAGTPAVATALGSSSRSIAVVVVAVVAVVTRGRRHRSTTTPPSRLADRTEVPAVGLGDGRRASAPDFALADARRRHGARSPTTAGKPVVAQLLGVVVPSRAARSSRCSGRRSRRSRRRRRRSSASTTRTSTSRRARTSSTQHGRRRGRAAVDPTTRSPRGYGVRAIPQTFFIDADGVIARTRHPALDQGRRSTRELADDRRRDVRARRSLFPAEPAGGGERRGDRPDDEHDELAGRERVPGASTAAHASPKRGGGQQPWRTPPARRAAWRAGTPCRRGTAARGTARWRRRGSPRPAACPPCSMPMPANATVPTQQQADRGDEPAGRVPAERDARSTTIDDRLDAPRARARSRSSRSSRPPRDSGVEPSRLSTP